MRLVDTGAGVLSAEASGAGPAALVLHGGPGLSDYMDVFAGELAGLQTIRYTQRGLAPSTVDGPFDIARHVADAIAVLDAFELEQALLVGHSWGAFLALAVIASAPSRVRGALLLEPLGYAGDGGYVAFQEEIFRRTPPEALARLAAFETDPVDHSLEAFQLLYPAYFAERAAAVPLAGLRSSGIANMEGAMSAGELLGSGGLASALPQFRGPVEVLYGEASPMPASSAAATAAIFEGGRVTGVPGAGHFLSMEKPGCVRDATERLLARTETP